jgi:hypothetical protein
LVPNVCQVVESVISLRPCGTGVQKKYHTIQIQNKEYLRLGYRQLNIIQLRERI